MKPDTIKKTRIIFMIDFIDMISGTENQIIKLINNLDHHKYDIYLVSLRDSSWIRSSRSLLNCTIKIFNIIKLKNPLNIIYFSQIIQYIKKLNPHIVITFFPLSNIIGVIAAKLANVTVIISTRRDYGLWLDWINKWSIYALRFANRYVNGIVSNSSKVKDLIITEEKADSSKIHVIYNGLDTSATNHPNNDCKANVMKKLGINPGKKIIGIVANQRPMKRLETFLNAAKRILQTRSDISFVLVGDGPSRNKLEQHAAELAIEDHVYFLGYRDNISPVLSIFDIGVNCSANEGLSNAIMEYMAYGIPCIVSKAGGNEELIENGVNGYTFELDNDRKLADLILRLLEDKEKQAQFISRSKEIVRERLSLDRMIKEYDRYFERLLHDAVESDKK